MTVTVPVVLTLLGAVLILAALFGENLQAKVIRLPTLNFPGRLFCGLLGLIFVGASVWLYQKPPSESKESPPTTLAAATSTTIEVSPLQYSSAQIARESNSVIRTPGQEVSSKYLIRKNLTISWNGAGVVSLSGDSEGPTSFTVDDILEISFTNLAGKTTGAPVSQDLSKHCTTEVERSGKTGLDLSKHLVPGTNVLHVTVKDNSECGGSQVGSSDIFLIGNFQLLE